MNCGLGVKGSSNTTHLNLSIVQAMLVLCQSGCIVKLFPPSDHSSVSESYPITKQEVIHTDQSVVTLGDVE